MLHALPSLHHNTASKLTLAELRQLRDDNKSLRYDDLIVDKRTGEIIGCYTRTKLLHEPDTYPHKIGKKVAYLPRYAILDDGTPVRIDPTPEANPLGLAEVIAFPSQSPSEKSRAGAKPSVLTNPISGFLEFFRFDGQPTHWIDGYVIGACGLQVEHEGSETPTTGRFNVAPSDVRRLLYLPKISTEAAAEVLCNHNLIPMCVRQVERVVQATRIALGGLMFHLERHTSLLEQFDCTVDFDLFWLERKAQLLGVSLEQMEAMSLFKQDKTISVQDVAKQFGVHRNTASKWKQLAMHN
ncbi:MULTISPECIES: hypothetical protein [unclassified Pseudomonas]|uniref:hypothetical protein n=1 Tax=unclassified Pseudomonas TaxID=196821 RepID=UPI00224AE21D|nr:MULTISPECIES: hypothetical protein [unclassified Pseudomonas]MCX2814571.1 hypothetical protein [Pseudomonas sp. DCB_E]MCX9143948.1 hypothetical protein [Pseudomonas sp. DCB_Q]